MLLVHVAASYPALTTPHAASAMLQRGFLPGMRLLCCHKRAEVQLRFLSTRIVQGVTKSLALPFPTLKFGAPSGMVRPPRLPPPPCSTCGT